jgi:hypothetical protein
MKSLVNGSLKIILTLTVATAVFLAAGLVLYSGVSVVMMSLSAATGM